MSVTDEDLVEKTQAAGEGDTRAFAELISRHQDRVLANCRYLTRSHEAEDLAQEVFTRAFFALPKFEGRSSFKTWIQRIKVNHCLNFLDRQRRKGHSVELDHPSLLYEPEMARPAEAENRVENLDRRQQIARVLESMSETLRVPLVLREVDGFSYQEIADQLGVGLSAVKMRIKRARNEFRDEWALLRAEIESRSARGAEEEVAS